MDFFALLAYDETVNFKQEVFPMTFGKKLQEARKQAGFTQEQLAEALSVSRSAVAKWESDKGLPDLDNMKTIARALDVSIDYLLDDGTRLDLSVTRKPLDLRRYGDGGKLSRIKKIKIKERVIREEFPDAEIKVLTLTKIKNTKADTIVDQSIGWFVLILGNIPLFGAPELIKMANSLDQQFYLVNQVGRQFFVLMTDEQMICRALSTPITEKKFEIGDKRFQVVAELPKLQETAKMEG